MQPARSSSSILRTSSGCDSLCTRDVAAAHQLAIRLRLRVEVRDHAAADLRQRILEHLLAVDDVRDVRAAEHDELHASPIDRRRRSSTPIPGSASDTARRCTTTSMPGEHMFAVGRALPSLSPPSNCASIEIGKSCSFVIVCGGCEWNMMPLLRSAQAPGPCAACSPTKRYSTTQPVIRVGLRIEQVTEARLEAVRVAVVTHLQQPVLDAKCLSVVVAQLVMRQLRRPAGQVAAVEQLDPFFVGCAAPAATAAKRASSAERCELLITHAAYSIVVTSSSRPSMPPSMRSPCLSAATPAGVPV